MARNRPPIAVSARAMNVKAGMAGAPARNVTERAMAPAVMAISPVTSSPSRAEERPICANQDCERSVDMAPTPYGEFVKRSAHER